MWSYAQASVVGLLFVGASWISQDTLPLSKSAIEFCRRRPGTVPAGMGKLLGLVEKEITVVVSDVEGSTDLWES